MAFCITFKHIYLFAGRCLARLHYGRAERWLQSDGADAAAPGLAAASSSAVDTYSVLTRLCCDCPRPFGFQTASCCLPTECVRSADRAHPSVVRPRTRGAISSATAVSTPSKVSRLKEVCQAVGVRAAAVGRHVRPACGRVLVRPAQSAQRHLDGPGAPQAQASGACSCLSFLSP